VTRAEFDAFKNSVSEKLDVLWRYFVHLWQKSEEQTIKVNDLEQHSRHANVIIRGMPFRNFGDEAGMYAEFREFIIANGCGEKYTDDMFMNFIIF
jgi:hypothetical protein